jgi:hypothetical protein
MSKKTIRLTESDLKKYISKVVSEQNIQPQSNTNQQKGLGAILQSKDIKKNQTKEFLIQVLTNHLNNMKTDTRWQPNEVAQTIINDCNNFLQKKDVFRDTPKGNIAEESVSKGFYDKMVIDCLKKSGFKYIDTRGKYGVYMEKTEKNKWYRVSSGWSNPNEYRIERGGDAYVDDDPKSTITITPTTGCETIINTVYLR